MQLHELTWERFQALSQSGKAACFQGAGGVEQHVILAQQFTRARLDELGALATRIRRIAKSRDGSIFLQTMLSHKRAMLYFTQPSTRTFLSFCAACQILGIKTGEVRDTSTSSEFKGETKADSVRTFSSYFDLIIMRSQEGGLAERMAWMLSQSERPIPVINAGSGKDQHPTQALLDIYTLQRSFETRGGIDGKRIVMVGDLARGRTVRSLAFLLTFYREVELVFVAPEALQIGADILAQLDAAGVRYTLAGALGEVLEEADAVYMTRIQDEWDGPAGESSRIDLRQFSIGLPELERLPPHAVIMHPLPRRQEIDIAVDADPRAVYWRQMRNGMWIRAALIASMGGVAEAITAYGASHDIH